MTYLKSGEFGVTIQFQAKEGNVTMLEDNGVGGGSLRPHLANPIKKGDAVKLAGDMLVVKCGAGDTPIGFAAANPDDFTNEPTVDANDGEYERRNVSITLMGTVVQNITLEPSNSAITYGDKIKVGTTTVGAYDKGTNSNNTIALESASANSGAEIKALFGNYTI